MLKKTLTLIIVGLYLYLSSFTYAKVTPIQPGEHPNLYFNKQEISAIQKAVLVDKSPQYAVQSWEKIKNTTAAGKPSGFDNLTWPNNYNAAISKTRVNFDATLSYLIEPTPQKQTKLKEALLSWTKEDVSKTKWINDPQHGGHIQFVLPFMYDALYNSGSLSNNEKQYLDNWFKNAAQNLRSTKSNDRFMSYTERVVNGQFKGLYTVNKENSIRDEYANWWQFQVMGGYLNAAVSHDQNIVDQFLISTVPNNFYLINNTFASYNPNTRNVQNMISGLIYPSGYNWDGYHRNYGFNAPTRPYNGEKEGEGQHYHFFSLMPVVLAAEALKHSGLDIWKQDNNAILKSFITGQPWAHDAHRSTDKTDITRNWYPMYWLVYRNYPTNSTIKQVVNDSRSKSTLSYTVNNSAPLWGVLGDLNVPLPTPTDEPTPTPSTSKPTPIPTPSTTPLNKYDVTENGVVDILDIIEVIKYLFN